MKQGEPQLLASVNESLKVMDDDGTIDKIWNTWIGPEYRIQNGPRRTGTTVVQPYVRTAGISMTPTSKTLLPERRVEIHASAPARISMMGSRAWLIEAPGALDLPAQRRNLVYGAEPATVAGGGIPDPRRDQFTGIAP